MNTTAQKPLAIGIFGITGRMGKAIVNMASSIPNLKIISGTTSENNPLANQLLLGTNVVTDPHYVAQHSDILIDFSKADKVSHHLAIAKEFKKPIVVGVTGLDEKTIALLSPTATQIPVLYAANTSIGVTVLSYLVERAASLLDSNFDIEIFEAHHRYKVDAPSGTALHLGNAAAEGRGISPGPARIRQDGKRQANEIAYSVQRGGGIIGEHSVRFISDDEIVDLSHRSLSRDLFARGALKAAQWLHLQPAGVLYTMRDCLNLSAY